MFESDICGGRDAESFRVAIHVAPPTILLMFEARMTIILGAKRLLKWMVNKLSPVIFIMDGVAAAFSSQILRMRRIVLGA